jgi:hypothetical protein
MAPPRGADLVAMRERKRERDNLHATFIIVCAEDWLVVVAKVFIVQPAELVPMTCLRTSRAVTDKDSLFPKLPQNWNKIITLKCEEITRVVVLVMMMMMMMITEEIPEMRCHRVKILTNSTETVLLESSY